MPSSVNKRGLVPALRFPEFRDAGAWVRKKLGKAAIFYNGKAYSQEELLEQGKYKVLRVGNFFTNNNWYYSDLELEETKYCDHGNLLYAWSASFGPRIWEGGKVIYHYHIWKVVEQEGINKAFLFAVLNSQTERLKAQSANGLGLMHITKGAIEGWECGFPSEDEQQKIADCLTSIDELITAQSQKLDALKTHKKGLMQQLFPAEGETVPKRRFPEFQDAGEWEAKLLGEVVKSVKTGKLDANAMVRNGQYRFYTCAKNYYQIDHYAFEGEALLIAGNGAYLGYIHHFIGKFNAYQRTYVLQNFETNVGFLKCLLDRYLPSRILLEKKDGNTPYIVLSTITEMPLLIPKNDEEQQKIADCLASVDTLITAQAQKVESLKTHKKGLMQQLFPSVGGVAGEA